MFEFRHFSAHSSSTKKFEVINFKWLNTKLLELISVVSSDCRADIFACHFAAVYGAEHSFLSNDFSSLVTWQMSLSCSSAFLRSYLILNLLSNSTLR